MHICVRACARKQWIIEEVYFHILLDSVFVWYQPAILAFICTRLILLICPVQNFRKISIFRDTFAIQLLATELILGKFSPRQQQFINTSFTVWRRASTEIRDQTQALICVAIIRWWSTVYQSFQYAAAPTAADYYRAPQVLGRLVSRFSIQEPQPFRKSFCQTVP